MHKQRCWLAHVVEKNACGQTVPWVLLEKFYVYEGILHDIILFWYPHSVSWLGTNWIRSSYAMVVNFNKFKANIPDSA